MQCSVSSGMRIAKIAPFSYSPDKQIAALLPQKILWNDKCTLRLCWLLKSLTKFVVKSYHGVAECLAIRAYIYILGCCVYRWMCVCQSAATAVSFNFTVSENWTDCTLLYVNEFKQARVATKHVNTDTLSRARDTRAHKCMRHAFTCCTHRHARKHTQTQYICIL